MGKIVDYIEGIFDYITSEKCPKCNYRGSGNEFTRLVKGSLPSIEMPSDVFSIAVDTEYSCPKCHEKL
jgi:hypothetical protein